MRYQTEQRKYATTRWCGLLASLMLIAAVVVGCGDDADEAPPSSSASAAPTTDAPADSDQGDNAEEPASSTTAAPVTSTTTSTAPPVPANGVLVARDGILGWVDDGQWRLPDDPDNPVAAGLTYRVVGVGEQLGTVEGSAPMDGCFDGIETVDVGLEVVGWPNQAPIAASGDWDLFPREVEALGTANEAYVAATSELLAGLGIDDESPELVQVVRLDLEGDGVDEVIVVAQRNASGVLAVPELGDYGVAFLRRLIEGEVQEAVLGGSFVVDDPDELLILPRLTAVADLNGDGVMELVVTESYFEGSWTSVLEYVNDDVGPVEILMVGCGS